MDNTRILMLGESLDRQGGIVSVEKLIINQSPPEMQIVHVPTLPNGSNLHKTIVFFQALLTLLWRLIRQQDDLLHIHVAERGSAFRQALTTTIAWMFKKPVILHTHGSDFHIFYAGLPSIIQSALSWMFCKSTKFIVLSKSWGKYYIDNLGLSAEQVIVLPNPVKFPAEIPTRVASAQVNFLFLGRIGDRKGAFDLIEACAKLSTDSKQNLELIIAGDGDGEKARKMVETNDLSQQIKILDWVNEEERNQLLAKANVFVLPSYNEGLPMAILEAMSWELPIITTPVGGIPELVINLQNGLLIQPGDIQSLSAAIHSLIIDPNLRQQLGRNARDNVKCFDIQNYLISLSEIYQSVLS
jgi:glycosyltransferase involved in cell wall biosynthesis